MVECREQLGFAPKASKSLLIGRDFSRKEFERDFAAELGVAGPVHLAHAALAEQLDDLVVREGLSNQSAGSRPE